MPLFGEAKREYARLWMAKRRAEFFADKTCKDCECSSNLELHHRDPALKVSHRIWSWSLQRRKEEIAKCDVVCHTCHLKHTIIQKKTPITHGTKSGYNRGCRCALCKAKVSELGKKRNRKKCA